MLANLSRHSCHASAFFRATVTGFRAVFAMFRFVLFAFVAARITNVSAHTADLLSELRASAHKSRCSPANLRTIPVESDAFRHHCDILLAQAGIGTVLAHLGTLDTGVNTGLVLFVGHESLSFEN